MGFISELKRRNVIRMAGLYIVGAWLILQVSETLLPIFDTPGWVLKALVYALVIGFLPVLAFSWIFELTPEGLKRDAEVLPGQSIAPQTAHRMERVIIAVFAVALLFFVFDRFVLAPKREAGMVAEAIESVSAPSQGNARGSEKSIAVMPFVNMSSDKEQEYFSDGMTEEILNALANVPNLAVTARTSVFSLKGKNKDIREIGKLLGVAYVLEGSVRKAGNEVRITAQLIRADNGFHLWSETYDRKLENVFDLQAELAGAIAKALELPLGMGGDEGLVTERTTDPKAYALYLQARAAYRERGQSVKKSIALYRQALALDPKFAPAWAGLCSSLVILQFYLPQDELDQIPRYIQDAEIAGTKALELAPDYLGAHVALGTLYTNQWQWQKAGVHFSEALASNPTDPEFYYTYTDWLSSTGRFDEALESANKAVKLDPMAPMYKNLYGYMLMYADRYPEAIAQLEAGYALAPEIPYISNNLRRAYVTAGRFEDAERISAEIVKTLASRGVSAENIESTKRFDEAIMIIARDPSQYQIQKKALGDAGIDLSGFFLGEIDDLFVTLEQMIDAHANGSDPATLLRSPLFVKYRKDPRYIRLLNKLGFDDEGNIR